MSYAGLRYYQNTTDAERGKFLGDMQEQVTDLTTPLVFFTLEMNRLDDAHLDGLLAANADLARYKPVFDRLRAMKPYQLSRRAGEVPARQFGRSAPRPGTSCSTRPWPGSTFSLEGEAMPLEATLNLLTDQDRARREAGARAWRGCSART